MVEADGVARSQKFRSRDGDWSRKGTRSGGARLAQRDPRQFGGATEPQCEAGHSPVPLFTYNASNASAATAILIESGSCSGQMKRVRISR